MSTWSPGSPSGALVHPIEPWFFGLLEANAGDRRALRAFMAKLERGEVVHIVGFGGSITAGMSASSKATSWSQLLFAWIREAYPGPKHTYTFADWNVGLTTDHASVDLIVIEMSVNVKEPTPLEEALLWVAGETAVLGLHWCWHRKATQKQFMSTTPDTYFSRSSSEDVLAPVYSRYAVPTLSFRTALLSHMYANRPLLLYAADHVHPNDNGHALIASAVIQLLAGLRPRPPGCPARPAEQGGRVGDPLTGVYDAYRHRNRGGVPPINPAALTARRANRMTARVLWGLATPADRKGWTLLQNETSVAGRVRPPSVATSTRGATFSFKADITVGDLTFVAMSSYKNFGDVDVQWKCPEGAPQRGVFKGYVPGGTSLPARLIQAAGVKRQRDCVFTLTNLGGPHGSEVRLVLVLL
jgi:hypothetical protein